MDKRLSILLLLVTLLLLSPGAVAAQVAPVDNACVVLVLDESGSMEDNDPTYLRNTGAKLLVSVLDEGDRVGIIRFSTAARQLTRDLALIEGPQDKRDLLALLQDETPDGYTDMKAALVEASRLLEGEVCDSRTIVLLSDGFPQLEAGLPAGYATETVSLVRDLNVPIFGIALTTEGESGLLYQLAAATDPAGLVIPARSASDLLDAYLDVVAHLKDRTVVGSGFTVAPGRAPLPLQPGLAQYVSRVTYIVSKPAGVTAVLLAPGGAPVSDGADNVVFAYEGDPRFTAFTVENPAPGDWMWALDGGGQVQARAILRSRLRVVVEQPAAYHALGEPMVISASLIEEEADGTVTTLIGQASFSAFITRPDGSQDELDRLYDDGTHGDARAGDGLFTNEYVKTDLPGEYTLVFTGYKGVIPATRTVRVAVAPFPEIRILAPVTPSGGPLECRGEPLLLRMQLEGGEPPRLDTGAFVAELAGPNGATAEVSLTPQDDGTWTGSFAPTADGPYTITFRPEGATYKGAAYTRTASRMIEVRLVPAIRLALQQDDIAAVEAAEAAQGITLAVSALSSSRQAETVQFDLVGIPDLRVVAVSPEALPPGESAIYVTLRGSVGLGESEGTLVATARPGVDLATRELPFTLRVYQPTLLVEPEALQIEVRHDRQGREEFFFTITSQSQRDETVRLAWHGPEVVELLAEPVVIPAGGTAELPFRFSGELDEGSYEGEIYLSGREGLSLEPKIVPATFEVVPIPWCTRWCLLLIGGSVMTTALMAIGYTHLKNRPRPWGSLKLKQTPPGRALPAIIPLKAGLGSRRVTIGSGNRAGIRLLGGQVRSEHAAIVARRQTVLEKVSRKLVPVERLVNVIENRGDGLVKVNGVPVLKGRPSAPLRNDTSIVIGQYEFIYRG